MERVRLVIAEARTLFRQGIAALLAKESGFEVVGEAADADEARRVCLHSGPDIVIVDAALPQETGAERLSFLAMLRVCAPQAALVVVGEAEVPAGSEEEAEEAAQRERQRALSLGASAYLRACVDGEELIRVLRAVAAARLCPEGERGASPDRERAASEPQKPGITERERAIIGFITQGLCNKEIAHRLGIGTQTVKNHVSHLLEKLALADRTQLAVYALEHHLHEP